MFEDSRSGFSAASENQWGEKVQWMFWMISSSWLAWEDADRDKGKGHSGDVGDIVFEHHGPSDHASLGHNVKRDRRRT